MRRLLIPTILILTPLTTGCMRIHLDTVIEADGGGTCRIELAMRREVADAIEEMGELERSAADGGADPAALGDLDRDRLAGACQAANVRLLSHELRDDAAGVHLVVTLRFDRLQDLSRALSALGSEAVARPGEELRITRTEAGDYLLANASVPGAEPAASSPPSAPPGSESLLHFAVLLEHVGELDVRRSITVPGEVISSNAPEVEGRTSIWVINAANMLEERDTGLDPRILFAAASAEPADPESPPRRD